MVNGYKSLISSSAVLFSEQEQQQHQLHVTHNAFSSQGEPPAEKRVRMSSTEVVQVKNQTEKVNLVFNLAMYI